MPNERWQSLRHPGDAHLGFDGAKHRMLAVTWIDGQLADRFGFSSTDELALAAEWSIESVRTRCKPAKDGRIAGESRYGTREHSARAGGDLDMRRFFLDQLLLVLQTPQFVPDVS